MPDPQPVLLLTRPEPESHRFLGQVVAQGVSGFAPVISPLLAIRTTGPLPDMAGTGGVIFTSANAVRAYRALGGKPLPLCFTVGDATGRAAQEAGFAPQSAAGDADALVAMIRAASPGTRLMHLRGTHSRGDICNRLNRAGIATAEAVIYDQPAQELSAAAKAALSGQAPVVLPLFSARSAAQFARVQQPDAPLFVAAISRDVAAALSALYVTRLGLPAHPDAAHMRAVVIGLLKDTGALVKGRGSVKG